VDFQRCGLPRIAPRFAPENARFNGAKSTPITPVHGVIVDVDKRITSLLNTRVLKT
jgi:hypothetical protein